MQGLNPRQEAAAAPAAAGQVDPAQSSAAAPAHTSTASGSSTSQPSTAEGARSRSLTSAAVVNLGAGGVQSAPLSYEPKPQAHQQQQDMSRLSMPDLAVLCADMGLQQQLCVPQDVSIGISTCPPGTSNSFGPIARAATATPTSFPVSTGLGYQNGHASEAANIAVGSSPAALSLSTAVLAANGAVGGVSCSSGLSRTSSSSSAAFQVTPTGSSTEQQPQAAAAAAGLLSELGVSMESLQRLLTADCADEFDQPVWMVVNLQGKIKGSYTPEKMLEFFRRGTLSASQLLLGIDQNLPYSTRQDLSFYRRLESLVKSVHCGARYTPLTEAAATALKQQGLTGSHWQLLAAQHSTPQRGDLRTSLMTPWASQQGAGPSSGWLGPSGSDSSGAGTSGSRPGTPAAAAAQLRLALERLCGCSVTEAMAIDRAAARAPAAAADSTAAVGAAAESELQAAAADASTSAEAGAEAAPAPQAEEQEEAAVQVPAVSAAGPNAEGPAASQETNSSTENAADPREPVWLYINHLGWCRGPFLGARIVQAHMCGRLPRDTLVAAHAPEVPSAVVSADIPYFFRPLGVLLDNVGNGWTYNAITWSDVATRDLTATATTVPLSAAERPWRPLKWDGPAPAPSLVNPSQLRPPQAIPSPAAQPLPPGPGRGMARSATGSPSNSTGARFAGRRARRDQIIMPFSWSSSQLQQLLSGFDFPPAGLSPGLATGSPALLAAVGPGGMQFPAQMQPEPLMPLLSRSMPASPQRLYSPQVVPPQQQQQRLSPTAVLLGHVQAQPNQAALPVYDPQQLALPSLQLQQLAYQEQQQQQQQLVGLNSHDGSAACAISALFSAVLPQQQALLNHDSSGTISLNGLQLQQGQMLQQAYPAGLQLQQQQQMLLLQEQQQQQQLQSVLQLQALSQHAGVLQTQQQQLTQQEVASLSQLLQQQLHVQQQSLQGDQQQHLSLLLPQGIDQQQGMMLPSDAHQQQQQLLLAAAQFEQDSTDQQSGGHFMPF